MGFERENVMQKQYTALVLAAALSLLAGCGNDTAKEPPPPVVRTMSVDAAGATTADYSGTVRARYETKLAFQVGGQVLSRNVSMGAHVHAGDVLMVINARDAQQQVNATSAGVASARAQLDLARANRARYEELYAAQAVSAAMLDQYRTNENAAEAAYRQALAQNAQSSNALGYTNLIAGADGVISGILAEEGQVVAAGQTVMTLTRDGAREIEIAVPGSLWANQAALTGTVREIAPIADAAGGTYTVRIALADAPADLPLGMTARVRLGTPAEIGAVLPLSAIYQTGDEAQVYIVEDGVVHLCPVTVTAFRERDAVVTGLPQNAVVVTAGVHRLHDGEKVRTK